VRFHSTNPDRLTIKVRGLPAHKYQFQYESGVFAVRLEAATLAPVPLTLSAGITFREESMNSKTDFRNLPDWLVAEQTTSPKSLRLDNQSKCVCLTGRQVRLTKLEFRVLSYLAARVGCVVSLEELLSEVWNTSTTAGGTTAQVKNCIRRLRLKIEPLPSQPIYIVTVFGHGYMMPIQAGQSNRSYDAN
jgi:DNA-binding winged helix-turn-helix (wHTH) protein